MDDRLDRIVKILSLVTALIGLPAGIVGLFQVWQGDATVVTVVLIALGVAALWLASVRVAYGKRPSGKLGEPPQPKFPKWWRLARVAILVIPLLTLVALGLWWRHINQPSDKIIVMVCEITGPAPEEYRVTDILFEHLRPAFADAPDVEIVPADAVSESQGSAEARRQGTEPLGTRNDAALVLWGWYGATEQAVRVTLHFEVLRDLPESEQWVGTKTYEAEIAQLDRFELQADVARDTAYVTSITSGLVYLASEDWSRAELHFSTALAESEGLGVAVARDKAYFYRGLVRSFLGDDTASIIDYSKGIELNPGCAEAYNNRGIAYADKGELDRAIADYGKAIELRPDLAEAYFNRGSAYLEKGELDRAIADFDKAIELRHEAPELLQEMRQS